MVGKKLKSRLEDLERRVGSSSASPPQMEELHHQQDLKKSVQTYERNSEIIHRQPSPTVLQSHRSNPMEISLIVGDPFEREESGTHPSHRQQPYRPVSTGGSQFGDLLIPFSASVPPAMCFYGAVEQEDETISQFNMCLSDIGHASHGYDLNPHVGTFLSQRCNSIVANSHMQASSISQSYNHSSNYSESGYEYHTTPGDASFS